MFSCLERDMTSAEDLAAVRTAIELCHSDELKKEVLCAPGSEYDRNRSSDDSSHNENVWMGLVENKATTILENLGLPKVLHEKVTSLVILIGRRILRWARYHERILGLTREYSIKFLSSSFFRPHGIIDNKKAAEELMKDSSLSIKQKYTLACLYCFVEHIPALYRQMSPEDKENFVQRFYEPQMVTFWTDYLMGGIDKLRGERTLDQYMLEKAVDSGSKAAVEYCLEETSLSRKKDAVIGAALETVRKKQLIDYYWEIFAETFFEDNPNDDSIDILLFLLSKTNEEQKKEFLKKDIEVSKSINPVYPLSTVLDSLLEWPYQNYFMKTTQLMWEFLPEWTYAHLLLNICFKINPRTTNLKNGVEKSYDYQKLLKEYWFQSPDHYKRYVFSDKDIMHWINGDQVLKKGKGFLIVKLLTLKNYTYEDKEIFEMILDSATEEEKESIISSKEGRDICIRLMEGEKWKILDRFLSECISSKGEVGEFKRRLCFTEEARGVCANFIKGKWDAAEFFVKWSSLSEDEMIRFKRELICSEKGKNACWYLFSREGGEIADRFCDWCFSSEEEIRRFKKGLIFSVGVESCADVIIEDKLEVADEFINWSHLSPDDVLEFKRHLQNEKGNYICENLISGDETWPTFNNTIQFQGGKWEQVEKFLTWCFSSEEEIRDFKKGRLLKMSGAEIHLRLIESNQWEEGGRFFDWLELFPEEVKELKKETLFNHQRASVQFDFLVFGRNIDFSFYGSRHEAMALILRWYLTDKETVLDFRDHFKQLYERQLMSEEDTAALQDFESAIEQHLSDLDEQTSMIEVQSLRNNLTDCF